MKNKKIPYLRLVPILLIAFVLFRIVNNFELVADFFSYLFSLFSYFIWGFAIAFLLNPSVMYVERRFKLNRLLSLLIVYLVFIGMAVFGIMVLVPKVANSTWELIEQLPGFMRTAQDWLDKTLSNTELMNQFNNIFSSSFVEDKIADLFIGINQLFGRSLNVLLVQVVNLTSIILKLIFGILLSIYMLKDKEKFVYNSKRLLYVLVDKKRGDYILNLSRRTNSIFVRYLLGKTLDSLIIGILCFIGLLIIGAPYSLFLALIVGITNMIPYFGPFFGIIPAFIITLFFDPFMALMVAVLIILLQQLDGWVIGPKILGDSVGMSPIWIIFAITIGGGLFGVMGMLLGVPVMAVLRLLLEEFIERRQLRRAQADGMDHPKDQVDQM